MVLVKESLGSLENQSTLAMERRRGVRVSQARPIKVFEPAAARYYGGQTHDVSSTGLRVELPLFAPIRPGKFLSVHVGLDDQGLSLANRRQMIPARVVWVDRSQSRHGKLMAGIEFLASISARLDAA